MKIATCSKCHELVRDIDMHYCGTCNRCYLEHRYGQVTEPNYPVRILIVAFTLFLVQVSYLLVSAILTGT